MRLKIFCSLLLLAAVSGAAQAQEIKTERGINQSLLKVIKSDIEDKYLDTDSHTSKLDESYKEAYELIGKSSSRDEMARIIGLFLIGINDPRIFYVPRITNVDADYQWTLDLVGNSIYVKDLDIESDAYAKGIRPGDRIYMLEGYILSRENFWKVKSLYEILSPQESLDVIIVKPSGSKYEVKFNAKVTISNVLEDFTLSQNRNRLIPDETSFEEKVKPKFYEKINGLLICRFSSFLIQPISVEKLLDKTNKKEAFILDLRGAGGIAVKALELRIRLNRETGAYWTRTALPQTIEHDNGDLDTLKLMVGSFLRSGQPIGELKRRKSSEKLTASSLASGHFSGKIAVLVDSETSGVAEVFARLVQLEKRGVVLGDVTSGRTVETKFSTHSSWETFGSPFGLQVPVSEIVMMNGDRLNEKGVVPDQLVLPSQSDLAKKKDPALSRAAELMGFKLSPEEAGLVFAPGK